MLQMPPCIFEGALSENLHTESSSKKCAWFASGPPFFCTLKTRVRPIPGRHVGRGYYDILAGPEDQEDLLVQINRNLQAVFGSWAISFFGSLERRAEWQTAHV